MNTDSSFFMLPAYFNFRDFRVVRGKKPYPHYPKSAPGAIRTRDLRLRRPTLNIYNYLLTNTLQLSNLQKVHIKYKNTIFLEFW